MMHTTKQPLPVKIPGTDIIVEATLDEHFGWRFITDTEKSFLHVLYADSLNPKSLPILQPDQIHRLWDGLRIMYEDGEDSFGFFDHDGRKRYMEHFYSEEAKKLGAEYGNLGHTLEQLHWEMRYTCLYMNALVVVRNEDGLIDKLDRTKLPATLQPVSAYTKTPVSIDSVFGISLRDFQKADGHIVAHGTSHTPRYLTKDDPPIQVVRWMLGKCEVDGPSNTYDYIPVNMRGMAGILRGRKSNYINKKS